MWTFALWIALLAAAGWSYPRRPLLAGVLFLALGVLSVVLGFIASNGNGLGALAGVVWIAIGGWYLVKYRDPDARKKHVDYWSAKA
jgi:hypothetical protein